MLEHPPLGVEPAEGATLVTSEGTDVKTGIGVGEGANVGDSEGFGDPHFCMPPFMSFPFLSLQLFFIAGSFIIIIMAIIARLESLG